MPWRLVPSVGLGARSLHHGFVAPQLGADIGRRFGHAHGHGVKISNPFHSAVFVLALGICWVSHVKYFVAFKCGLMSKKLQEHNANAQSKIDLGKKVLIRITKDIAHGDQNDLQEK